jgi:Flp pilus assembly protein TadG
MLLRLRKLHRDDDGGAMIEFTLLAPILILLTCGLGEFGLALRQCHVMDKAARDAGRYLSRQPISACSASSAWAAATATAQNLVLYGAETGSTPLLPDLASATVTFGCMPAPSGSALRHGSVVSVTVSAPAQDTGLYALMGLAAPTIVVSHQEAVVGD